MTAVVAAPVANTLITKVFNAVGIIYEPTRVARAATAEVEADKIRAVGQIEISDIQRRGLERMVREQGRIQQNIESITEQAAQKLPPDTKPETLEAVDDDWIVNFFDKCRLVSKPEMQDFWASILARQATKNGSFSKRTIEIVSTLEKADAELFTKVCGYVWAMTHLTPLIFDETASFYENNGIDFESLNHLASFGLITFFHEGLLRTDIPDGFLATYYGVAHRLNHGIRPNHLPIGKVRLTQAGEELAPVCGSKPVEGLTEYVAEMWAGQGVRVSCVYCPDALVRCAA